MFLAASAVDILTALMPTLITCILAATSMEFLINAGPKSKMAFPANNSPTTPITFFIPPLTRFITSLNPSASFIPLKKSDNPCLAFLNPLMKLSGALSELINSLTLTMFSPSAFPDSIGLFKKPISFLISGTLSTPCENIWNEFCISLSPSVNFLGINKESKKFLTLTRFCPKPSPKLKKKFIRDAGFLKASVSFLNSGTWFIPDRN